MPSKNSARSKASFPPSKAPRHRRGSKVAPTMRKDQIILVNLSGRGDKDVAVAARMILGEELKF